MLPEVLFGMVYFRFINQAHMTETAVGKFIDNRTPQPTCKIVVYECAEICADGCENNDKEDIHTVIGHRFPCSRRHYNFRWKWDK
jgi:hypothetical protein